MLDNFSLTGQGVKNITGNPLPSLTNSLTGESKNTFDQMGKLALESGQTLNKLTTNLTQSVTGLNQATTNLKAALVEATGGAVNTITEATDQATTIVKQTADQAAGLINDASSVAVHKLNDATSSITQTAENTKLALDETVQKAEQLRETIADSVNEAIVASMQTWLASHPVIAWMMAHPLWTIALIPLTLFLGWGLLGAIARLIQQIWLLVLQAFLNLAQSLFKKTPKSFRQADVIQMTQLANQLDAQKRLPEILSRLEALRQEQEVLMQEMRSILMSKG